VEGNPLEPLFDEQHPLLVVFDGLRDAVPAPVENLPIQRFHQLKGPVSGAGRRHYQLKDNRHSAGVNESDPVFSEVQKGKRIRARSIVPSRLGANKASRVYLPPSNMVRFKLSDFIA
jgi:hypothetical protein